VSVEFKRTLIVMTGIHLAVVLIIFFVGVFQRLTDHSATQEITTFVSIADPPPVMRTIEEPVAPPELEPVPAADPKPPPDVAPPPKEKKKITLSKKKVNRPSNSKPEPLPPKPSAANQISQQLENLKKTKSSSKTDFPRWYYAHVRQVVFASWGDEKPSSDMVMQGAVAIVSITVDRSGRITNRRLQRQSGSPVLDASALRAVNKVRELKPLPANFRGKSKIITINFELTG